MQTKASLTERNNSIHLQTGPQTTQPTIQAKGSDPANVDPREIQNAQQPKTGSGGLSDSFDGAMDRLKNSAFGKTEVGKRTIDSWNDYRNVLQKYSTENNPGYDKTQQGKAFFAQLAEHIDGMWKNKTGDQKENAKGPVGGDHPKGAIGTSDKDAGTKPSLNPPAASTLNTESRPLNPLNNPGTNSNSGHAGPNAVIADSGKDAVTRPPVTLPATSNPNIESRPLNPLSNSGTNSNSGHAEPNTVITNSGKDAGTRPPLTLPTVSTPTVESRPINPLSNPGTNSNSGHADLDKINAYRAANGKAPLVWSDKLAERARDHNSNMNRTGWHHGDYVPGKSAQNIFQDWIPGASSQEQIVQEYIDETHNVSKTNPFGHRMNILGDFKYFGSSTDGVYNTENFSDSEPK